MGHVFRLRLVLIVVLVSCTHGAPERSLQSDRYAVYAAALDSFAAVSPKPFRVGSRTWPFSVSRALGDTSFLFRGVRDDSEIGYALLAAFDSANHSRSALCNCFPTELQVELVINVRQPDVAGPAMLSEVGFDSARQRALVAVSKVFGAQDAVSMLYLVVRRKDGWRVTRRVLTGTS